MTQVELDPGLMAYRCPTSGGHWLPYKNYWRWLDMQSTRPSHLPVDESQPPSTTRLDADKPIHKCPETGALMTRFKVGHGFPFSIDHSPAGLWFDEGEWQALRKRNFHEDVHLIMTSPWQTRVRKEALQQVINDRLAEQAQATAAAQAAADKAHHPTGLEGVIHARLVDKLGPEAMDRVDTFKAWLEEQPTRREILAYLHHDLH